LRGGEWGGVEGGVVEGGVGAVGSPEIEEVLEGAEVEGVWAWSEVIVLFTVDKLVRGDSKENIHGDLEAEEVHLPAEVEEVPVHHRGDPGLAIERGVCDSEVRHLKAGDLA